MLKVLHVGHSRKWRGGENQIRLLIEELNRQNHASQHYLAFPENAVIFERLIGLVEAGIDLPSSSSADPRAIWAIRKACKEHAIDVLHAHSSKAHTLALLVKKTMPSLKLVVHRRVDNEIKSRAGTRRKYLDKHIDSFICVSEKIQGMLLEYGVRANKINLVLDSIDTLPYEGLVKANEKAALCAQHGLDPHLPLIGFVSALEHQKNPELFIAALSELKKAKFKFNAIVAGTGSKHEVVDDLIQSYGLKSNVVMLGFIKNVPPIFSALDVFVLPSRNEGLGTVLLEAMAAETAVVAANVGGIGEVVIHKETGLLINNLTPDDFAQAIQKVIDDKTLNQGLIDSALAHTNRKFNLSAMAQQTAACYQSLFSVNRR